MDKLHYEEMVSNLEVLLKEGEISEKRIYLFGHCNATEELVDLLFSKRIAVQAILDNNAAKQGHEYRGVIIKAPYEILRENERDTVVCIVARAYDAMLDQLRRLGYKGVIHKLVDYNSYAAYSLSEATIERMKLRVERGKEQLAMLEKKYPNCYRFLCPFAALGDIYYMMSYLPHFMEMCGIEKCVIVVIGGACAQVVQIFGIYNMEIFSQKNMDEAIQAALYTRDKYTFIPHQDRPYAVNLHMALYIKKIPLEKIYCCGVYGLPENTLAYEPTCFKEYEDLEQIEVGNAVIFSPYAKSVTALPDDVWEQIVLYYVNKGYQCYTNAVGDEKPLIGTKKISPKISEMKSVVERAGTFIGIRSGLCDVLKTVEAEKIALYPDYNYCDTQWKAIDIYTIDGWKNIVVKDDFEWKRN